MRDLRYRPKKNAGAMYRGVPVITVLLLLSAARNVRGQEQLSFESFISRYSHQKQELAREYWQMALESVPVAPVPVPVTASDAVSDTALVNSLTTAYRERLLSDLAELRRLHAKSVEAEHILRQESLHWHSFLDDIQDVPRLGDVYLKALGIVKKYEPLLKKQERKAAGLEKQIENLRVNASLDQVSANFTVQDWIVIIVYLIFTTILGAVLAGKQTSIKDFFLGGRKLPWPAVCGSIMATELSAATFLIAPAIVFSKGGDMTYLQLAAGTILARFIIGYFFVPAYYKHEIYSPYDYMGNQLGPRVKNITSILFMIGGVLAQGARIYIAAKALQVITGTDINTSIIIIGAVSIGWTIMGGITTVIWTDAIQFVLFSIGAVAALIFIANAVDGGIITVIKEAIAAGKFRLINVNFNLKDAYLLWCGLFATSFLTLGSHGTDQLMAQRMFTCKNQDDARKAITWSSSVLIMTFVLLMVGAAMYVYYKYIPFTAPEQVIVNADSMKVFAVYIVDVMPPFLSGLLMAAIFATAISTADSILAALSQTTISIFYRPFIKSDGSEKHYVMASRIIVFFWGIFLTGFAIFCHIIAQRFGDLIQFALAMAAYTYGALLGTFLMAFLPTRKNDTGLMWSVPLSLLIVFALNWHQPVTQLIVLAFCLILIVQAVRHFRTEPLKIAYVGIGVSLVLVVSMAVVGVTAEGDPVYINLAWPWHYPVGTIMTFVLGYLVGERKE
ncbi:sodium/solute symporter [bacterium]|nr:sodium/solute symporter [bacterium]